MGVGNPPVLGSNGRIHTRACARSKEKDSFKVAEKLVFADLLKHPNARFQIQAMMDGAISSWRTSCELYAKRIWNGQNS